MSVPTFSTLLSAYMNAMLAVATNQSYTVNGRTFTRADLPEIRATIDWLQQQISAADTSVDQTGTGIALIQFN